jgi:hypothetical protein
LKYKPYQNQTRPALKITPEKEKVEIKILYEIE